jgi:hypothetical protein
LTHIYHPGRRSAIWKRDKELFMASHRIGLWGACAAFLIMLQAPALAQQGTQSQRDACTPDAFRLCMNAMPDPQQVEACLRASGRRLSQPCYDVFYPPQDVQQLPQQTGRQRHSSGATMTPPPQMQPPRRPDDDYDD